ncbi:MAG: hypothetical protein O7C39_05850 [Bacteroidetes bacterium]|nr:hypothetical protein [Bacteroidota bacterium]
MEDLVSSVKSEIDESAIDVDTKNSLKGAVGSWGAANASERFRQLMIDYGVVDEGISGLPLQRMKFVSSMRNGIVHNGEIRKPVWIEDEEIQCQISYHLKV